MRNWRLRVFAATWLCYAGYYFCRRPFYVAKGKLAADLNFDASTLGTIGAIYLIAYAAGQFIAGSAGTRAGPRVMMLTGMAISVAVNIGFGLSSSSQAFFILMTINGLAQATGWSSNIGTMASWFNRQERGTVMGLWATNFQVGGVVANAMASWLLGDHHWPTVFFAGSAVLSAVWLFVLVNQRNTPADVGLPPVLDADADAQAVAVAAADATAGNKTPNTRNIFIRIGWDKSVILNILIVGMFYFFVKLIRYALWSWSPFFLASNYHLGADTAGYVSILFDAFGVPGVIVTGWVSDRYFQSSRAGVSLMMTLLLLSSCIFLYTAGSVSVGAFAVGIAVAGFSLYGPDALLTGAGAMDIGNRRGAILAAALISGIGSLGPIVQELVIGKLYDAKGGDLSAIFLLLLLSACGAVITMTVGVVRNRLGYSRL